MPAEPSSPVPVPTGPSRVASTSSARTTGQVTGPFLSRQTMTSPGRRGRAIPPLLYEYWLTSLCDTVGELDPAWDEELEKKWRVQMRAGMQVVTANY